MVKIGVLSSSRADFGVYLPLLRAFSKEPEINYDIIAFGTHLSNLHGYTIADIKKSGYFVKHQVSSMLADDSEEAIATSAALTSLKFADFWANQKDEYDLVLCIGDRYEMFSAVIAGVPFGIKFAHLYGGDYSKGAIDNVYRDAMTHASIMHFTSNQKCADRVFAMTGTKEQVEIIGILSLEELDNIITLSTEEFKLKWNIDLNIPTILISIHPETVNASKNVEYAQVFIKVLSELCKRYQLLITMPNADTFGSVYRKEFELLKEKNLGNVFLVENFGSLSYFTCMKYSVLMLGNTSSGISEAASFKKYFVNVGDRQIGREMGENVISVPFDKDIILNKTLEILKLGNYNGENIYRKEGAVDRIISKLKSFKN